MSDEYEVKYGDIVVRMAIDSEWVSNVVGGEGWQNPYIYIYNARYAVLIGGDIYAEKEGEYRKVPFYWNDIKSMYDMLLSKNWIVENIYILFYNGLNHEGLNPDGIIDYAATEKNFTLVINTLKNQSTINDLFLFAITSHGNSRMVSVNNGMYDEIGSPLSFSLYYGYKSPIENDISKLKLVRCARSVVTVESCYSGGLIRNRDEDGYTVHTPLMGPNVIIITSSRIDRKSWSTSDYNHKVFLHGFITGLGGETNIKNAFDNGKSATLSSDVPDARIQYPQLDDDGDCLTEQNNDPALEPSGMYIPGTYNDGIKSSQTYI
ncbi:MAG: hypothetical protein AB1485_04635 [Candidatus Thermoplasmatota archaeon]